jgi:hypothetical protein
VNSPPPKPEVILTNFFAEPTVLLVPITSRVLLITKGKQTVVYHLDFNFWGCVFFLFTVRRA